LDDPRGHSSALTIGPPSPSDRWRGRQARRTSASLLLALLCLLIYNANLRGIGGGDTLPARYLPFAIWRHGTLELDPIARFVAHGHPSAETWSTPTHSALPGTFFEPWAYWMIETRHHNLASLYPVVAPLLVAPLYLPAVVALEEQDWPTWQVDWLAAIMEKLSASLLATVTVLVVYRLLQREAGRWALPLAVAFAFGTNTWMTSSQALWQQGTGELLVALALLLVTSTLTPTRSAALGAVCVVMAANRPPDTLLAVAIALYAVWVLRRRAAWLVAGAVLPLALVVAYNLGITGSLTGGYGTVNQPGFFKHPLGAGLAGLLVSPMRGLLVFSPFLLFVPLGLVRRLRTPGTRVLAALLTAAVIAQLMLYAKADWRMGASWGPRWLTDTLPVMMWLLAPVPLLLRTPARVALVVTMAVSISVQTIGAFWYTGRSDPILYASADGWMPTAWQVANAPFVVELNYPPQRGDLACSARGYLDRIGPAPPAQPGAVAPVMVRGAKLQGWALACGRTPAEVLLLADGLIVGQTRQFAPARPDVAAAMGTTAPSTWSVEADTRGLAPGERVLQVAVRADERSGIRIVNETRVRVEPPLAELARRAAALLREHQSAAGYWLTTHTVEPRFANPGQEMNTFLTAMLVDLLTPVAKDHGLEDVVDKARRHLAAQIEPGGLVRYHGLPDGPGMGTLGCAITPDADDTALTWRIAPPPAGDSRRASMLRVLKDYRDARGFYRTWLAPQERYECLNPGRDPNPPDVTIQMHVLMMLAETDRAAAQSLCKALAGRVSDESLWVYYARAPIVPLLRTADLQRIGCAVTIPGPRLAGVAEQARWIEGARRLVEAQLSRGARPDDGPDTLAQLGELGRADFAELRRNPPLLYHNDLTATVSRYYWSEDFGYALWLRLYESAGDPAKRRSRTDR
jgi:hypothetical protein